MAGLLARACSDGRQRPQATESPSLCVCRDGVAYLWDFLSSLVVVVCVEVWGSYGVPDGMHAVGVLVYASSVVQNCHHSLAVVWACKAARD